MGVEDYEVLKTLGKNCDLPAYKVKFKEGDQIFVWYTIETGEIADPDLENRIRKRLELKHAHILKFYDIIKPIGTDISYLMVEYCSNGSLQEFIRKCKENNTFLSEELVCRIVYQVGLTMKTVSLCSRKLYTKNVFLDENFNVKLSNFSMKNTDCDELSISSLGVLLFEVLTLQSFNENYKSDLRNIEGIFSNSLLALAIQMIEDADQLQKHINKIICHPTVVLKSSQWMKDTCYSKGQPSADKIVSTTTHTDKFEKSQNKMVTLQMREQTLREWEHRLVYKEKRIAVMERSVREKLQRAEIYLKHCRDLKSANGGSSRSRSEREKQTYENLDSTYVSCGDSVTLPTSKRLDVNRIEKPAPFTRTLSERRIRFKGHSPLKEMNVNARRYRPAKPKLNLIKKGDYCTGDPEQINTTQVGTVGKCKQLFPGSSQSVNDMKLISDSLKHLPETVRTTWTKESKRQAFELLRLMNNDKDTVKHTFL